MRGNYDMKNVHTKFFFMAFFVFISQSAHVFAMEGQVAGDTGAREDASNRFVFKNRGIASVPPLDFDALRQFEALFLQYTIMRQLQDSADLSSSLSSSPLRPGGFHRRQGYGGQVGGQVGGQASSSGNLFASEPVVAIPAVGSSRLIRPKTHVVVPVVSNSDLKVEVKSVTTGALSQEEEESVAALGQMLQKELKNLNLDKKGAKKFENEVKQLLEQARKESVNKSLIMRLLCSFNGYMEKISNFFDDLISKKTFEWLKNKLVVFTKVAIIFFMIVALLEASLYGISAVTHQWFGWTYNFYYCSALLVSMGTYFASLGVSFVRGSASILKNIAEKSVNRGCDEFEAFFEGLVEMAYNVLSRNPIQSMKILGLAGLLTSIKYQN